MAGHSKWANIKFRKAAQDAKRGKVFTKLIKEITVSARLGGADSDSNPRLRSAIDKGLAANMTRDTIDRAIKRGAGSEDGADLMEIRYEGYGPGGVAFLVECTTDNRNRTVSEVRHAFSKYGGNLGTDGSVAYLFNRVGVLVFSDNEDEEKIIDLAIEAGADDVDSNEGMVEVTTSPDTCHQIAEILKDAGLVPEISEVIQRPASEVQVSPEQSQQVATLIDALEELDDVQDVFTNLSMGEVE
ncbi:MAG: YebC/PmpR family DNA-binding transcriptional regulator [Gammaproteobacteria bacterium]|nr:YebC/PmpR family DNA-binding transcriptional regulator [Gammaproteobacteria bacterium]MCY4226539.1 YebC/PmpR family DNA-binding transcriptional regulator [Gammaproteobacteria bacterium]